MSWLRKLVSGTIYGLSENDFFWYIRCFKIEIYEKSDERLSQMVKDKNLVARIQSLSLFFLLRRIPSSCSGGGNGWHLRASVRILDFLKFKYQLRVNQSFVCEKLSEIFEYYNNPKLGLLSSREASSRSNLSRSFYWSKMSNFLFWLKLKWNAKCNLDFICSDNMLVWF